MDTSSVTDAAVIGGFAAAGIALVRAGEAALTALSKKWAHEKAEAAPADERPGSPKYLREAAERIEAMHEVIDHKDIDGIPMVYTPRSILNTQLRMAEALRDTAVAHDKLNERLGGKLDEVVRLTHLILSSIPKRS